MFRGWVKTVVQQHYNRAQKQRHGMPPVETPVLSSAGCSSSVSHSLDLSESPSVKGACPDGVPSSLYPGVQGMASGVACLPVPS